jgi:hypothetical protein
MKTIIENKSANNSRIILGAIIVLVGGVLLADQFNISLVPDWLFNWPIILILIGLYNGAKHNFNNLGWLVWIFIGGAFLLDDALPGMNIGDFAWPAGLIILGVYLIARRSFHKKVA